MERKAAGSRIMETSREVPTLYETEDSRGKRRILLSAAFREETETQPPGTGWRSVKTMEQHGPS